MLKLCHRIRLTQAAWSRILQHPSDPFESIRGPLESLRGKLEAAFFTLDTYDILAFSEFPEEISPSAISVAFSAGGVVAYIHTTRLLPTAQFLETMRRANPQLSHSAPMAFAASTG